MSSPSLADHPADKLWQAPHARGPVRATVEIPGSKSLSNRYLVLAALANAPSELTGVLDSRDTALMRDALEALGATITPGDAPGSYRITPLKPGTHFAEPLTIEVGLAGTVMRFIPPVAALMQAEVHCVGDPEASARPMGPLLEGLRQAGVRITAETTPVAHLPFTVYGTGSVPGGTVCIDASGSSQFVSGLLLCAAHYERGLSIRHTGSRVPSPEHVGMTLKVLAEVGVETASPEPGHWIVSPGPIRARNTAVEPDLSNAGVYLAAAVITGGRVSIPHWPRETTQIGDRWQQILPRFGADVQWAPNPEDDASGTLTVTGQTDSTGKPIILGAGEIAGAAELVPTIAALALVADSETALTGIGHLRGHETDRLHAIVTEATKLGARVHATDTALYFSPSEQLRPATLDSWADHRMATFGALAGLHIPGVSVRDITTTSKTMPRFPLAWSELFGLEATAERTMVQG
ncbi:3-phosphoshikimate 1-carboxyvinyltransferase [Auritidibacter ignavus]|uniref:3-phosphoshikimate 1-carboxyvinyltransferase n=1 Tax=Auritidibacter ignavus TaxID=678932 RepID=A0AAJ6DCD2_9MICC|nr:MULTISPECIES: 3-phosphoshikimate 1-carboxyvinyltransferase [Auritidibacter]AXR73206.1 3-phosphoshikimate 1-carboxyvinyltransferase [Auritidibacter sp. NML130574]WGH93344.1 3-phosphoshikimate 1-carboxyvinyltransferase [Auritidibacter ignavus]